MTEQRPARPMDILDWNTKWVATVISKERMDICKACPNLVKTRCTECGCFMRLKTKMAHAFCPIHKWEAVDISITEIQGDPVTQTPEDIAEEEADYQHEEEMRLTNGK